MSIATEISKLQTNLANSYTACSDKGAILPANENFDNLSTTISAIPSSGYSGVANYEVTSGVASKNTVLEDFTQFKTINQDAFCYAFHSCSGITGTPDMSTIETIGLRGMQRIFQDCTGLSGNIGFTKLTTVGNNGLQYAFGGCTGITGMSLPELKTCTSNALASFLTRTKITSLTFPKLDSIKATGVMTGMCGSCTLLTSISFPALKSTSFGNYTNQFNNMLTGVTGCTVHFPSNLQSVIGSWSSVTGGFGGTNTTVLYDLTATS